MAFRTTPTTGPTIAELADPRPSATALTAEERAAADVLAAKDLADTKMSIAEYGRAYADLLRRLVETPEGRERLRCSLRPTAALVTQQRATDASRIGAGSMEKYAPRQRGRAS